ncbi:hypothetical protein CYY_003702 [Polysphondylium violaceum]|uniref:Adenine DNA glycosylase n=1 Tax=Polysphondylium violaceum TaxID=133409 RepID=A0A8J4PWL1_9MYCE|nr:hypothetical protein CYY_003702 [Polysphondylium violaceum]
MSNIVTRRRSNLKIEYEQEKENEKQIENTTTTIIVKQELQPDEKQKGINGSIKNEKKDTDVGKDIESEGEEQESEDGSDADDDDDDFIEEESSEEEEKEKKPKRIKKEEPMKSIATTTTTTTTTTTNISNQKIQHMISYHQFQNNQVEAIRKDLLKWYQKSKRDLPWRSKLIKGIDDEELNNRGYRVWVSEIMLQQTRVATVIDYYNAWMNKWPTIKDLASATLDQVNQVWAGLGYYRRAKNLHLGAQFVLEKCKGKIPRSAKGLLEIPGIGPYTAGAIASIAFGLREPLVDGNVIRVLCRLRSIGSNPAKSQTTKHLWQIAGDLVDPVEPGDFNQSLMELGATLCSVTSPQCGACPINQYCQAYTEFKQTQSTPKPEPSNSISRFFTKVEPPSAKVKEESKAPLVIDKMKPLDKNDTICNICINWEETDSPTLSVTKYPQKVAKVKPRDEVVHVFVLHKPNLDAKVNTKDDLYFLVQRPETGLLASLWEAPSLLFAGNGKDDDGDENNSEDEGKKGKKRKTATRSKATSKSDIPTPPKEQQDLLEYIDKNIISKYPETSKLSVVSATFRGKVTHQFSHITQTLHIYDVPCRVSEKETTSKKSIGTNKQNTLWVPFTEISKQAISNQMQKCFDLYKTNKK